MFQVYFKICNFFKASPRESGATANNGNHSSYCDGNATLGGVGGNVTFYDQAIRQQSDQTFAAQFGASNKTFNASDFNNTTTNNTAGHHGHGQAETTLGQAFGVGLGGPYPDLLAPNDVNATFLGRTLLNSQANQGAGVQIPVQSLATGYSSSMVCLLHLY